MYALILAVAVIIGIICLCLLLPLLKRLKAKQEILCYVTEHSTKAGTPTMGGIAVVVCVCIVCAIFFDTNNTLAMLALLVSIAYAISGLLDDYIKVKYKQNEGLRPYQKIIVQLAIAVTVAVFIGGNNYVGGRLLIPFTKIEVDISNWIIPIAIFVFLAVTNGVNLTDGLDGLASCVTICYLIIVSILIGLLRAEAINNGDTLAASEYLNMLVLTLAYSGALIAFLLFNVFPAKVFMGDTGSMALGGVVACSSMFSRMTLFIPILGIVFVISCVSVIVQVTYFKLSKGKRVFLMTPYHHHLQKKGWSECRVGVLYSVITIITGCMLLYAATSGG